MRPDRDATTFRDSPRFMAADLAGHLPSYLTLALATLVWVPQAEPWVGRLVIPLLIALGAYRLMEPVYRWATVRYEVTGTEVRMWSGVVDARSRVLPWGSISAVETESTWALRLFGLHRVTVTQAGDVSTRIVFRGVDAPTHRSLLARVRPVAGDAPSGCASVPAPPSARPDDRERTIYAASWRDLVAVTFLHARFVVLAPTLVASVWEVLQTAGADVPLADAAGGISPVLVAAIVAVVVAALAIVATAVQYRGFHVSTTPAHDLVIRYGLIETRERNISAHALAGVVVQRNLLEQVLGRARLSLLTTDSGAQLGTNLILPTLPRSTVAAILREHFPGQVAAAASLVTPGPVVRSGVTAAAMGSVGAGAALVATAAGTTLAAGVLIGLGVILLSSALFRQLASRLAFDAATDQVAVTSHVVRERRTFVSTLAVHTVASVRPAGSAEGTWTFASLRMYAGSPRRLTAARCRESDLHALSRALVQASPRIARTKREARAPR
ncbi:PH domain-containing protein [Clavibacter sp. 199]|jgi:putative membrane protein|uniref:PH domain-containing protein n=1 Tax=Clavibacter nebraskensis TaxID=31963 RepID=UPI000E264F89